MSKECKQARNIVVLSIIILVVFIVVMESVR
jgi:hypothetical protein